MRLADDLHRIDDVMGANAYLVTGPIPMIVDTGMPRQADRILAYLAGVGVQPGSLRVILLTHHDLDHVGSAAALQRSTGAEVWAPAGDIPYIHGELPRHGMKRYLPKMIRPFFGPLEPVRVTRPLQDGDEVPGGFQVVATPGHTPGHISLHRPGVLIVGDLLVVSGGGRGGPWRLRPSAPAMSWNTEAVSASIRRVGDLSCEMILAGHGGPVPEGGDRLLAALVRETGRGRGGASAK